MTGHSQVEEAAVGIQALVAGGRTADQACKMLAGFGTSAEVVDAARSLYEQRVGIISRLKEPAAVVSPDRKTEWYGGPDEHSRFWFEFQRNLRRSLPGAVADEAMKDIDEATSRILDLAGAPGKTEVRSKGLVLGYVQSGKTTNFMGVMAKAADAGYRLFIVLSGITDNLRSQTQQRIEEVLVGDMSKDWYMLTDIDNDFGMSGNAANLLGDNNKHLIAVVKKNGFRLRRLKDWINSAGSEVCKGLPLIVIDDEADQASLNAGRPGRVTRINGLIGQIIAHPKSAYIAYTATPFANLLTDPMRYESLYPEDFIVEMKQPKGYFGPERLFGRDALSGDEDDFESTGLDVIRIIDDHEANMARPPTGRGAVYDWWPTITPALRDSIDWFLMATAARRARWEKVTHSTMLIHTSMLSEAHNRMRVPVAKYIDDLEATIAGDPSIEERFREQWLDEVGVVPASSMDLPEVSWRDVWERMPDVLSNLKVIVDNFRSPDRLYYKKDEPTTAIVIGGNTLSRGLTLEGLVSSYFVRAASAYDTLLQMGRWFGYRNGYEDLPRIWMPEDLAEWFAYLATVEEEIRRDIRSFGPELRPRDVAVRIRRHPSMAVTSAAKMRGAVNAAIDYSGKREQTILFEHLDDQWLEGNLFATRSLFLSADREVGQEHLAKDGRLVFRGISSERIIEFLRDYQMHENAALLRSDLLIGYIKHQMEQGGLKTWNVVLMENASRPAAHDLDLGLGRPVHPIERSRLNRVSHYANIKSLVSRIDRIADIDVPTDQLPRDVSREDDKSLAKYRQDVVGDVGLLVVYPIDKDSKVRRVNRSAGKDGPRDPRVDLEAVNHVIGLGFFFPEAVGDPAYNYVTAAIQAPVEEDEDDFDLIELEDKRAAEESEMRKMGADTGAGSDGRQAQPGDADA